jgi:uncharacterized protein (DUF4415 family)
MKEKSEKSVRWTKRMLRDVEKNLPQKKKSIYIRLDEDILAWFKAQGERYQAKINAVIKAYIRRKK